MTKHRMRRWILTLVTAATAAVLVAACGSSGTTTTTTTKHHEHQVTKQTTGTGAGHNKAASTEAGSGAVLGGATTTGAETSAPADSAPVDAIYGPPSTAIATEDVPGGNTSLLANNGTPSAAWDGQIVRQRLAKTFQIPADQNFTAEWFAGNSPWNLDVANYPIDSRSAQMLRQAQFRVQVISHGTSNPTTQFVRSHSGVYINTVAWTDPVVRGGPETPIHCRQEPNCGDDPKNEIKALTIPRSVSPNSYYDGWLTVISPNGRIAYDLWRARRLSNGSISFAYMRIWDLDGPGYGKPDIPSARGSGLPLFAGLIRPSELAQGQIDHALAISIPGPAQRFYVQPASTTDGSGPLDSVPEGARLRLKGNIRIPDHSRLNALQRRYASALLWTLRNYGAIVVDRSAVPTLYGQQGVTAPMLVGNELQFLKLSDFQVINLPPERQYPSTAARNQAGGGSGNSALASIATTGGGY